jgi:hypothetical protein
MKVFIFALAVMAMLTPLAHYVDAAYPDQLGSWAGTPCQYGPYSSYSGNIDCWAAGNCASRVYYPDVAIYQSWNCSPDNSVTVDGNSDVYYSFESQDGGVTYQSVPNLLHAEGSATPPGYPTFVAIEEDGCADGDYYYSGGFSYSC